MRDQQHVFITGLPRMRSAWCASFLSYGDCAFLHDAFLKVRTMRQLQIAFEATECPVVGLSDPFCVATWQNLWVTFPDAKWIVIDRPLDDVKRSVETLLGYDSAPIETLHQQLDWLCSTLRPEVIPFDKLSTALIAELVPGFSSPSWRNEMFDRMNIQVERKRLLDEVAQVRTEIVE